MHSGDSPFSWSFLITQFWGPTKTRPLGNKNSLQGKINKMVHAAAAKDRIDTQEESIRSCHVKMLNRARNKDKPLSFREAPTKRIAGIIQLEQSVGSCWSIAQRSKDDSNPIVESEKETSQSLWASDTSSRGKTERD
jgi:hypothetical protein